MTDSKYRIDFCSGSILGKMIIFAFPLLCTYELQSLFNAADMAIIGKFASHQALAAIGVTLNPIALMLNSFIGLSTGANAVISKYFGARNHIKLHRGTHTAMAIAVYGGVLMTICAIFIAKPLLILMNTPQEIFSDACLYIWIYFLGIPFLMIFNFGCAILRSAGDSRRPLYFMIAAGILNVILNLLLVAGFRLSVAGVAIATTISNGLAAGLVLRTLMCSADHCHLRLKDVKIDWSLLKEILWIGIPAGINSSFFNVANIVIQTSLNTFGAFAIAGSSITVTLESFCVIASNAFQQAVMTIVAQNYGAKNYSRTVRSCVTGLVLSPSVTLLLGLTILIGGHFILSFFTSSQEVIEWGMLRVQVMMSLFFIGTIMDVSCGCLRGLGYPVLPTASAMVGACFFRIFWVLVIAPHHHTLQFLLACYPISWIMVAPFNCIMLYFILKKIRRRQSLAA